MAVAILMQLSGTVVKRATLVNADQMSPRIHEGDWAYVERRRVIPKIIGVEPSKRLAGAKPNFLNSARLRHSLVREENEAKWFCPT